VAIDKVSIILFNDAINLQGYTVSVVDGMNKAMGHLWNNTKRVKLKCSHKNVSQLWQGHDD